MSTGSRRWFGYEANNGDNFAVELDESVYETPALGFTQVQPGATVISVTGRRPLRMRYLNVSRTEAPGGPTIRGKFYVGSQAAMDAILAAGSVTVEGEVWSLSSEKGESRKLVPLTDTEQLDGDVDQNIAP